MIQQDTFITVLGMMISGARYAVENPIPFKMPSVAAPHPKSVNGPRNIPSGASTANTILMISVLIHTDLPEPVAPAMRRCGILAISATTVLPAISFPPPKESLD